MSSNEPVKNGCEVMYDGCEVIYDGCEVIYEMFHISLHIHSSRAH